MDFQGSDFHIVDTLLLSLGGMVFMNSRKMLFLCVNYILNVYNEAATMCENNIWWGNRISKAT